MWYNSSWLYRVKVTVQASKVPGTLTNFPVYVDLSDLPAGFHANVNQTDARDIRVTKADGSTELPREVVNYDSTGDTGQLHFKADTLSSSVDTDFYIYYGNPAATEPAADSTYGSQNVWDSNYAAVWHLEESGNGSADEFKDSTANAVHGQGGGGAAQPTQVTGQIENGQSFDGGDVIDFGTDANLNVGVFSIEGVFNVDGNGSTNDILFTRGNTNAGTINFRRTGPSNKWEILVRLNGTEGTQRSVLADSTTDTAKHYIAASYDGSELKLYVDGIEQAATLSVAGALDTDNFAGVNLGKNTASAAYLTGDADEVRFSNQARPDDYFLATKNNLMDVGTFLAVDVQENFAVLKTDLAEFGQRTDTTKALSYEINSRIYSRENNASLPSDTTDLDTLYSAAERTNVATDNDTRVGVTADNDEYAIHQYRQIFNTDDLDLHIRWNGKTDVAPSTSTVFLQVYNYVGATWETIDSDNSSAADSDFTLEAVISTDIEEYYDANGVVAVRVYQREPV